MGNSISGVKFSWTTLYSATVLVDGRRFKLGLWDLAGQEVYVNTRKVAYVNVSTLIFCEIPYTGWSARSRTSFC